MQQFSQMLFDGLKGYVRIVAMDVDKKILWARHFPPSKFFELLQDYEPAPDIQLFILPVTRSRYSAKKEAACEAQVLWIDIDRDDEDLSSFSIKPNIHVSSGKGHHYYWLLEKPISLRESSSQTKFEQALKALQMENYGDAAVTHVSANMRMPGSFNLKHKALDGSGVGVKASWNMIHDKPVPIAAVSALAESYAATIPKPEPPNIKSQQKHHTSKHRATRERNHSWSLPMLLQTSVGQFNQRFHAQAWLKSLNGLPCYDFVRRCHLAVNLWHQTSQLDILIILANHYQLNYPTQGATSRQHAQSYQC